jgi:putative transposase
MSTNQATFSTSQATFPIATMARVLGVSKAGYYAWRHRSPSAHALADAALLKRVRTIHASSRETMAHRACMPSCRQTG